MWIKRMALDERTRSNTRFAAAVWLAVTQVLLAAVVFYRLFVLGQPGEQISDLRAVLAVSIFGYIGLQLFLGGVMPRPTLKGAIVAWAVLAGLVTGGCLVVYGWPSTTEWSSTWLPATVGPALFVGVYAVVAWLGQKRIERQIGE